MIQVAAVPSTLHPRPLPLARSAKPSAALLGSRRSGFFAGYLLAAARLPAAPRRACLQAITAISPDGSEDAAYERDRLAKDAAAMAAMKGESERQFAKLRTPWKWTIRKRVWDYMEDNDIAQFPRPVHHRIPNFKGAEQAAERLCDLECFRDAQIVKVNPDTPQKAVRERVLLDGKTLLTPQPRLRTGFFSVLSQATIPADALVQCTTSKGVAKHGRPVSLRDEYTVDLVVVGSTAVCPRTGARVGKGEGFAELEWGILTLMGNIDADKVLVVTTVHDCQVVDDIPAGQLTMHDVPVDVIVTPTRVIWVPDRAPKPSGVKWELLSPQKLAQIRVLQTLKMEIEAETGEALPEGPEETLPPTADRGKGRGRGRGGGGRGGRGRSRGGRGRGGGRGGGGGGERGRGGP